MMHVCEYCIKEGLCRSRREFFISIGFPPENANQLLSGKQSFRLHHIHSAAKQYGINVNWILGLEKQMLRNIAIRTAQGKNT
jgi:hypothetical protein